MILFKSGSFRMMGKADDLDTLFYIYQIIEQFSDCIPEVTLQTMTACHSYGRRILLEKLAQEPDASYTAEHFPAVQIRRFKPIHINIFSSGKITLTGVKDVNMLTVIEHYLDKLLVDYFL